MADEIHRAIMIFIFNFPLATLDNFRFFVSTGEKSVISTIEDKYRKFKHLIEISSSFRIYGTMDKYIMDIIKHTFPLFR